MRPIVRKLCMTTVQVLEADATGKVSEVETVNIEGKPSMKIIRRYLAKHYPDKNVFVGTCEQKTFTYRMEANDFLSYAKLLED